MTNYPASSTADKIKKLFKLPMPAEQAAAAAYPETVIPANMFEFLQQTLPEALRNDQINAQYALERMEAQRSKRGPHAHIPQAYDALPLPDRIDCLKRLVSSLDHVEKTRLIRPEDRELINDADQILAPIILYFETSKHEAQQIFDHHNAHSRAFDMAHEVQEINHGVTSKQQAQDIDTSFDRAEKQRLHDNYAYRAEKRLQRDSTIIEMLNTLNTELQTICVAPMSKINSLEMPETARAVSSFLSERVSYSDVLVNPVKDSLLVQSSVYTNNHKLLEDFIPKLMSLMKTRIQVEADQRINNRQAMVYYMPATDSLPLDEAGEKLSLLIDSLDYISRTRMLRPQDNVLISEAPSVLAPYVFFFKVAVHAMREKEKAEQNILVEIPQEEGKLSEKELKHAGIKHNLEIERKKAQDALDTIETLQHKLEDISKCMLNEVATVKQKSAGNARTT